MIPMGLIGVVLLSISILVCYNVYRFHMNVLDRSLDLGIRYIKNKNISLTLLQKNNVFVITTSSEKNLINDYEELHGQPPEKAAIGSDTLSNIIHLAKEGSSTGNFFDVNLKYKKILFNHKGFSGYIITFADSENAYSTIYRTLLFTTIVFFALMLIFLIILIWLSHFVVKPIDVAWTQQQQFLADASHELKTPLTAILMTNKIMLSHLKKDAIEERKWLENSQAEANHMKDLIENMLFLARGENTEEKLSSSVISLNDIVTDILLQFEPIAFDENIRIATNIQNDIFVKGDIVELRQLTYILVDNAYKYCGDEGFINISLLGNASTAHFIVNNSGTPIPEEDLPHIFERFYRSDKSRTQRDEKGGYGLGLAIAKKISTKHNASIKVTSSEDLGTTFTVTFKQ